MTLEDIAILPVDWDRVAVYSDYVRDQGDDILADALLWLRERDHWFENNGAHVNPYQYWIDEKYPWTDSRYSPVYIGESKHTQATFPYSLRFADTKRSCQFFKTTLEALQSILDLLIRYYKTHNKFPQDQQYPGLTKTTS